MTTSGTSVTQTIVRPAGLTAHSAADADATFDAEVRRKARAFVSQLHVALKTAQTHERSNVIFTTAIDELFAVTRAVLRGQEELHLEVVLDEFQLNERRIRVDLSCYYSFKYVREVMAGLGVGGVRLGALIGVDDLATAVLLMARGESRDSEHGAPLLNQEIEARGVNGVEFEAAKSYEREIVDPDAARDRRRRAIRTYEAALDFIKREMTSFPSGEVLNVRRGKRLVQALVDSSYDNPGEFMFAGLSAIRNYHPYTFNHIVNVCLLAISFGQRLGLDRKALCEVGMGALFHDIGKLNVPTEILDKTDPLTPDEWTFVQRHPLFATKQLLTFGNLSEAGISRLLVALQHHMAYDLKGYPRFRTTRRLHLYSRIVAIVDAYDAMVSNRTYDRAMLPTKALEMLAKHSGGRFDPLLVKAFINCIGLFPVGSLVSLNTGELAVVVQIPSDLQAQARPGIRMVRDADGGPLDGRLVDLTEDLERSIQKCVDPEELGVNVARYVLWEDPA